MTMSAAVDSYPDDAQDSTTQPPESQSDQKTTIGAEGQEAHKTIACVSCRKRKLKCDRIKPKCGTCTRLRHECEFPERRRNLGSKRRNMRELEARLAHVETQLVSEQIKAGSQGPAAISMDTDWNGTDINLDMADGTMLDTTLDTTFNAPPSTFGYQPGSSSPTGESFCQELLEQGLYEPLPPQDMMDELYVIYFSLFHKTMPMIHKYRFYASLDRAPQMRPPVCLRYAMWTLAASLSEKYTHYEDLMYERARRYLEAAEMKGQGETFVSVYHAQSWSLLAAYEAKKTYFSRAWMSTGRVVRLSQMLGLYRLDGQGSNVKRIVPSPRDCIDLEERRRTFWAAFYGDRWASAGTGWPMLIDEKEIKTHLPASEEAFEHGLQEDTLSLSEALTPEGATKISPFAGVILSATLFGHNFQHLHWTGPEEHPEDIAHGEFWKRHRKMDNTLSNTFMFMPEKLRLPYGLRDMNIVFIHMNIHASAICLHQAALLTADKYNIEKSHLAQSRVRCLMAAVEIANIMRLICHVDASNMNSWMGFFLYVAAGVFIKDLTSDNASPDSETNMDFILAAMQAIGAKHSITHHFTTQLELDMETAGITRTSSVNTHRSVMEVDISYIPKTRTKTNLSEKTGFPMHVATMEPFVQAAAGFSEMDLFGNDTLPASAFVNQNTGNDVANPFIMTGTNTEYSNQGSGVHPLNSWDSKLAEATYAIQKRLPTQNELLFRAAIQRPDDEINFMNLAHGNTTSVDSDSPRPVSEALSSWTSKDAFIVGAEVPNNDQESPKDPITSTSTPNLTPQISSQSPGAVLRASSAATFVSGAATMVEEAPLSNFSNSSTMQYVHRQAESIGQTRSANGPGFAPAEKIVDRANDQHWSPNPSASQGQRLFSGIWEPNLRQAESTSNSVETHFWDPLDWDKR